MKIPTLDQFLSLSDAERASIGNALTSVVPRSFSFAGIGIGGTDVLPTFVDRKSGIPFKMILSGSFAMGCSVAEERAARRIANPPPMDFERMRPVVEQHVGPFLMSVTPVLIGEYLWAGGEMHGGSEGWPGHPVSAPRESAIKVASKLGCRLPREVEWEYACRGTTRTLFVWGDELLPEPELDGWLNNNFGGNIPRQCNRFGLKGLFTGEWCLDEYRSNYLPSAPTHPGEYVIRGGGAMFWPWQGAGEWIWCASAIRMPSSGLASDRLCGFRLVREVEPAK